MSRQYPLHMHVSTVFVLLIAVVVSLLLGLGYLTSRDLIHSVAEDLTLRIGRETTGELQRMLQPVETAVNSLAFDPLVRSRSLSQRMRRIDLLKSVLDHTPVLSSLYAGYPNGDFVLVRRIQSDDERIRLDGPVGTVYVVQSIERGVRPRGQYLYLDAGLRTLNRIDKPDYPGRYDPRQRGWYQQAMASGHTVMNGPYLFFSDRQVGITMAVRSNAAPGVVIGADIQLKTLGQRLAQQKVTPRSQLALVDAAGTLFAHEDPFNLVQVPANGDPPALATLENFRVPVLRQIAHQVDLKAVPATGWIRLGLDDETDSWQVAIKDLGLVGVGSLLLVIALPNHELLAAVYGQTRLAGQVALLIILLSIPVTWWLARAVSRPLVRLTREADAIRHFEFGSQPELSSHIVEVNKLAQTISNMKRTIRNFLDLSASIAAEQDFDKLLPKLLGETVGSAEAGSGILYLCESDGLHPVCALQPSGRYLEAAELERLKRLLFDPARASGNAELPTLVGPLLGRALLESRVLAAPVTIEDRWALGLGDLIDQDGPMFGVAVPLMNRQLELSGALVLFSSQASGKDLLSFIDALSGIAAVSLEAKALIKGQKQLFEAFIRLIADAIDAKSAYAGAHCSRVPELTHLLAQAACDAKSGPYQNFAMNASDWETLRVASWLHDCGKVTTPEFVVDKATKLETIYNRIHEVRMRFEVLKRDARIEHHLRVEAGADRAASLRQLEADWRELDADFALVAQCNEGGEALDPDRLQALQRIARRSWLRTLDHSLGLSHEERSRLGFHLDSGLPVSEPLLADRVWHRIERAPHDRIPADNPWGFRMAVPELLYNQGELYNLGIGRGTLTGKDRYKINEHIVQTEMMLRKLPFPRHLQRVPEIAAAHHEKLDGTGYPKGLVAAQLAPEARMLAIADIFEALTASDRPYKPGHKLSRALSIMAGMRDQRHIDADLFELFLRSGVYLDYARRFMRPEQIDAVDIEAWLGPRSS